jgi:hypothetical protein
MAKIKIYLEDDETIEQAEDLLFKAMQHHRAGAEHKQAFHQPSARDVFNKLIKEHEKTWSEIQKEINKIIDEDVF